MSAFRFIISRAIHSPITINKNLIGLSIIERTLSSTVVFVLETTAFMLFTIMWLNIFLNKRKSKNISKAKAHL